MWGLSEGFNSVPLMAPGSQGETQKALHTMILRATKQNRRPPVHSESACRRIPHKPGIFVVLFGAEVKYQIFWYFFGCVYLLTNS